MIESEPFFERPRPYSRVLDFLGLPPSFPPLRPLQRPPRSPLPDAPRAELRDALRPSHDEALATLLERDPAWLNLTTPPGLPLLSDYARFAGRHPSLIAGLMLAGILLGFVWSMPQPATYSATASIALAPVPKYVLPTGPRAGPA